MKNGQKIITLMLAIMLILTVFAFVGQAAPTKGNVNKTDNTKENLTTTSPDIKPKYWLKIHAPIEAVEGESFKVFVSYVKNNQVDSIPIPAADVTVIFDHSTYITDKDGKVSLIAPLIINDKSYDIIVQKKGFEPDTTKINIINIPSQLEINAPTSVYEGTYFGVMIIADNQSIPDAFVEFNGIVKLTSPNGSVSFTAPQLTEDTDFEIHAFKYGYLDASSIITILNSIATPMIMFIMDDMANTLTVASVDPFNVLWSDIFIEGDCNISGLGTYVLAGDVIFDCQGTISLVYIPTNTTLGVFYFSQNPTPTIVFMKHNIFLTLTVVSINQEYVLWSDIQISGSCNTSALGTYVTLGDIITDCQGMISFVYIPTNTSLGSFNFTSPQLEINAPSSVYEGSYFGVEVHVQYQPVYNVRVWFNGKVRRTSQNGSVSFTAPYVNDPTVFEIYAFKTGYQSVTTNITVLPLRFPSEFGTFGI